MQLNEARADQARSSDNKDAHFTLTPVPQNRKGDFLDLFGALVYLGWLKSVGL